MRREVKYIVRALLIFSLIICWGVSLGYTNNIKNKNDIINFYFENGNVTSETINNIEESEKDISVVGWTEKSSQSATNPNFNRTVNNLKVLAIKGNSSLIFTGAVLFEDDKEGCLIDTETSYKLFGSTNSIGREIVYEGRNLIIRGIHDGTKSNIIVQLLDDSIEQLNGLTIDAKEITRTSLEEFKTQFGISEMPISGGIYYLFAKAFTMIIPIVVLILLLIKIATYFFKAKRKPILKSIYILMAITIIFIFLKVTDTNISIPLDMIPNKWSDFDFWSKLWKEYMDKLEYVLYMKKYGIDIYSIENLIMCIVYSIATIILFIVNKKLVKINNINELIYSIAISVIATFASVLIIWSKYSFDINIIMIWWLYPLYLCGDYFISVHEKYLISENKIITENTIKNIEFDL